MVACRAVHDYHVCGRLTFEAATAVVATYGGCIRPALENKAGRLVSARYGCAYVRTRGLEEG